MKGHNVMRSLYPISRLSTIVVGVSIGLSCLLAASIGQASQADVSEADELKMVSNYETAMADGEQSAAIKYALDYTEKAYGENAPATVELTRHYGYSLYEDGDYRTATEVLKKHSNARLLLLENPVEKPTRLI